MNVRRVAHISECTQPGDYTVCSPGTLGFYGDIRKPQPPVVFACFDCGKPMTLFRQHSIQSIEPLTVSPSVVCPHTGCSGHYFIRDGGRA